MQIMKNRFLPFIAYCVLLSIGINAQSYKTQLLDVFHEPNQVTTSDGESIYNEVWGFVQNGEEYGVIGSTEGTFILKITLNNKLELVQFIQGKSSGTDLIHRDYHDYNGYLYEVCDEGYGSLRIYDLSYLPDSVHIVYDESDLITRSHNIYIDTAKAKLYSFNSTTQQYGIEPVVVFSLANPVLPVRVGTYPYVTVCHDGFVRNDTAYLNCANEGLRVVDFSTPSTPLPLGALEFYPDKGYNHSGWLSEDGNLYVLCDETPAMGFKVLDVSDLSDIKVLAVEKPPTYTNTLPHNVMLKEGIAYFSYYNDGLQIYNLRNPSAPSRIGYLDTYSGSDSSLYRGAWGIYSFLPSKRLLISDRKSGLYLIDFDAPPLITTDTEFGIYPNPSNGLAYFYHKHNFETSYSLFIYDNRGRKVAIFDGSDDFITLNLQHLPSGMYYFTYLNEETTTEYSGKFMIAK